VNGPEKAAAVPHEEFAEFPCAGGRWKTNPAVRNKDGHFSHINLSGAFYLEKKAF